MQFNKWTSGDRIHLATGGPPDRLLLHGWDIDREDICKEALSKLLPSFFREEIIRNCSVYAHCVFNQRKPYIFNTNLKDPQFSKKEKKNGQEFLAIHAYSYCMYGLIALSPRHCCVWCNCFGQAILGTTHLFLLSVIFTRF